ncbi:hypothetical protein [Jidongwangia harbinensis]|uniref:hypothetical protein n=1 Tax=Jidongwangia harbinensis TaxID=2878561 RepID=UPI001CD91C77|nr:hypothetical protein [Jidongwangia harbinensis]MCA2212592.1 hypothetical protein [Jidongwangia harbinensis]
MAAAGSAPGPVKATPPRDKERDKEIAGAPAQPFPSETTAPVDPPPQQQATPVKAAPPRKPARKAAAMQQQPAEPAAARTDTDVAVPRFTAAVRTDAWAKLVADPGHSPELLALAAVQTIGPRAQEWALRTRESYPNASAESLARLAQRQFVRFGSVGGLFAAVAGTYAPMALLASNALTYAELILHVAAAYGIDPTDERRAADLLVLANVHPSREDAEAALAAARQPAYEDDATLTDAVWRLGRMVAVQAGAWMAVRAVNRVLPGTALLAAVMTSRNGARTMGGKATAFYRAQSRRG